MPQKLLKPCRHPGCPKLVQSGYCEKHRTQYHKNYTKTRTDRKEQAFYFSKEWRLTSANYRVMHPICERCGERETRIVHHTTRLPELLEKGLNPCDERYLEGCCWSCHEKTKRTGDRG